MTYTLLLRKMLKYSKYLEDEDEVEEIQQAVDVMERLINNIDQMMVVDRLRDFNVSTNTVTKGYQILKFKICIR